MTNYEVTYDDGTEHSEWWSTLASAQKRATDLIAEDYREVAIRQEGHAFPFYIWQYGDGEM